MTSLLADAFVHHTWATERLIDVCAELTREQLETSAPGTRGSIIATFQHMAEGETFFLSVVSGEPIAAVAENASLGELRSILTIYGATWMELLARGIDGETDVVEHGDGWDFHAPLGFRLAQVIHHGSDHRSQICTVLSILGVTPPEIDLWAFGEATGRTRPEYL